MIALLVIGILVFLIIFHELGHFIAAKISGVKVQEFGVGYPPRAFLFGSWGGTEYTLNWIPFGGFVRLFGDEGETGERGKGSFVSVARDRQAMILAAGVVMNIIAAWLLFSAALAIGIPRPVDTTGPGVQLLIASVVPGSPADVAGIHAGDQVIALFDDAEKKPPQLTPEDVSAFVDEHGGTHVTLEYEREHHSFSTTIVPANAVIPDQAGRAALGIGLTLVSSQPLSWSDATSMGFSEMWSNSLRVIGVVGTMIGQALHGAPDLSEVVGPVGLVSVVGQAAHAGIAEVLALAGFISINLAVINLLPIPALDGGRLVVIGIEAIMRRRAPKVAIHLLNAVGISAIILLMVVVTYHDIARLIA